MSKWFLDSCSAVVGRWWVFCVVWDVGEFNRWLAVVFAFIESSIEFGSQVLFRRSVPSLLLFCT